MLTTSRQCVNGTDSSSIWRYSSKHPLSLHCIEIGNSAPIESRRGQNRLHGKSMQQVSFPLEDCCSDQS